MKIIIATDDRQPNDRYRGALICAGAMPEEVVLARPGEPVPREFDGLLVAGGADLDPSHYGEAVACEAVELSPERDALDLELFARAQKKGVPVFGICRGLQLLNVAMGGTLWQDLPSQRNRGVRHEHDRADGFPPEHPAHAVTVSPTRESPLGELFRTHRASVVNSRHHQAVKDLAAGLVPLASSPDDLVEAFERADGPYLAAVQWHPEDLVAQPFQKALLRSFVDACRVRGGARAPVIEVLLEGSVPVVRVNRPAKRNAFAGTMREMLAGTIEALGEDPTVPAIVLTGAGGAFSAGGDLDVLRALLEAQDEQGFCELLNAGARAVLAIVRSKKPVIAAIDGAAAGAGMNLALACDLRVASTYEGCEAFFAQSFAAIGLSPDWGGTFHLPLLAGPGNAADLVFSAERISAHRAKELGIVDLLVDDGPSLPAAIARARTYAERPAAALAAAKRNLNAERLPALERALAREAEAQLELFRSGELLRHLPVSRPRPMSLEPQ